MKLVIKRTLAVLSVQYCNNPSQSAKLSDKYSFQSLDSTISFPISPDGLQLKPHDVKCAGQRDTHFIQIKVNTKMKFLLMKQNYKKYLTLYGMCRQRIIQDKFLH